MFRSFTAMNDSKAMQIVLRFLPLVVVGYLLFSLSGGLPAANWQLLLLIALHLNALHTLNSLSLRIPVAILSVQSLLLIVAWVWLIIVGIREIQAFLNGDSEEVAPRYRRQPVQTPLTSAIKVKMPIFNTKKPEHEIQATSTRILAGAQPSIPAYMQPDMSMVTLNATSQVAEPVEKVLRPTSRPVTRQAASPVPVKKSPIPFRHAKPAPAANVANTVKKPAPRNPFDVQPEVFNIFDQSDAFDDVNAIREASRVQKAKKDQAMGLAAAKVVEKPVEQPVEKPVEKPVKPEFVFGNPFEGPLPEVFEYDTDLKKSIFDSRQSSSEKTSR